MGFQAIHVTWNLAWSLTWNALVTNKTMQQCLDKYQWISCRKRKTNINNYQCFINWYECHKIRSMIWPLNLTFENNEQPFIATISNLLNWMAWHCIICDTAFQYRFVHVQKGHDLLFNPIQEIINIYSNNTRQLMALLSESNPWITMETDRDKWSIQICQYCQMAILEQL